MQNGDNQGIRWYAIGLLEWMERFWKLRRLPIRRMGLIPAAATKSRTLLWWVCIPTTRETFGHVQKELGKNNVEEVDPAKYKIGEDEYLVALKCGETDFHFARLDENGELKRGSTCYDDDTIYFVIKEGGMNDA